MLRKLIFQNMVTLDGFFEGPNHEIDWHNVDEEFNDVAIEFLDSVDTLIFGRVTYELMAAYWPSPAALTDDPIVAGKMNNLTKIVFSTTLKKAQWSNTRLVKENAEGEISRLKHLEGKDLAMFGSCDLALTFVAKGLIDEFRLIVNPVVLGSGRPLLDGLKQRLKLRLLSAKTFRSGNVLLSYRPQ